MIKDTNTQLTAEWVDGAWARHGRRIEGGELIEPTIVLWLTTGQYFADIREFHGSSEPHDLDKTQAFSGRIAVANNIVRWHHDLDTMPRPDGHVDANPVHGTREDLVEVGENYMEFWHRVDRGCETHGVAELVARDLELGDQVVARVVLVDDRAIAVWSQPRPGASLFVDRDGWRSSTAIGSVFEGDLMPVVLGLATEGEFLPGWSRTDQRTSRNTPMNDSM